VPPDITILFLYAAQLSYAQWLLAVGACLSVHPYVTCWYQVKTSVGSRGFQVTQGIVFMPPQAMCIGGCYIRYANMDSSTGWASPLQTCSSGGIIWPCTVLCCRAETFLYGSS